MNNMKKLNNMKKSELRKLIKKIISEQLGSAGPRPLGPGTTIDFNRMTMREITDIIQSSGEPKAILKWLAFFDLILRLWVLGIHLDNQYDIFEQKGQPRTKESLMNTPFMEAIRIIKADGNDGLPKTLKVLKRTLNNLQTILNHYTGCCAAPPNWGDMI